MPLPLPLALVLALCAAPPPPAEAVDSVVAGAVNASSRSVRPLEASPLGAGCVYGGAWHAEGARVRTGAACLQCACRLGALACRHRACPPLPEPPPRCHLAHREGACCPDLLCPDGVVVPGQDAAPRLDDDDDDDDMMAPNSISHVFPACVEGGSVFAAGSALPAARGCERCYCLQGARRCLRPRCLPPPPGCRAPPAPAPALCCPHRYHCDHDTRNHNHTHDCLVAGEWVREGAPAPAADCSQCFCLRGAVRCQPLACAPPLLGCTPLLRAGDCCAHRYHCQHQHGSHTLTLSSNALSPVRNDDRAFHTSRGKQETTTKNTLTSIYTSKNTPQSATKNHLISTTKVKRKTSDPPPEAPSVPPEQNTTAVPPAVTTATDPTTADKVVATTGGRDITTTETTSATSTIPISLSTAELTTETPSTEQPESSVRIMINGTINCTAELSSTSLPLNVTLNDTEKITQESLPRVPLIDVSTLEDHTFSPNDIITDRTVDGGFDENESFVINVTSSLNANTHSRHNLTSTRAPLHAASAPAPAAPAAPAAAAETNSSKKTKGDYDYDYTEPTLPPSLPNLKIIPFVAADAVVDDDTPKEALTYPMLEREDKFPVYYPTGESKHSAYVTRRDEVYRSTQYPVFITDKPDERDPSLAPEVELTDPAYPDMHPEVHGAASDYPAPGGANRAPDVNLVTQSPLTTSTFRLETPAVNLFSPPVETEGGFVPKGPTGLIEEYFAVYPSTPPGPPAPRLTTSMQLDVNKGECVTSEGRRVAEGATVLVSCARCTCAWGELACAPRACPAPPARCTRRPASRHDADPCCGELVCHEEDKTTPASEVSSTTLVPTEATPSQNSVKPHIGMKEAVPVNNQDIISNNVEKVIETKVENMTKVLNDFTNVSQSEVSSMNTLTTTAETVTTKAISSSTVTPRHTTTQTVNQSLEYEEEEDDDSFSFGSVLKLLLSDSYETTTTPPKKIQPASSPPPARPTTTRRPRPTLPPVLPPKQSVAPFVPLPIHSYKPTKGNQNSINRIDHLVLGEATAIKKTTPRPVMTTPRAVTTSRPTTRASKPAEVTIEEAPPRPPAGPPGLGPGLLKLAGCNIYGRMYRVGRIITELSTPCQECWCTELGVQCKQLPC